MNFSILFITQDDPFYVRLFFEEFFQMYKNLEEIMGVVIANAMGRRSLSQLARQMYNFYGLIDFIRMGSRYAKSRALSIVPEFIRGDRFYTIAQVCRHYGIKVIHETDINTDSFLNKLKEISAHLIVSVAAPIIFKQDLIQLPKHGCINIHNGKLPRYRGMLPNFWQMYHDEKTIGITVHEINPGIDDGRIILQRDVAIEPTDTLDSLIKKTKRIGANFVIESINMIKSGTSEYKENIANKGSYFSFPTREDVKEFKRRGKRVL